MSLKPEWWLCKRGKAPSFRALGVSGCRDVFRRGVSFSLAAHQAPLTTSQQSDRGEETKVLQAPSVVGAGPIGVDIGVSQQSR